MNDPREELRADCTRCFALCCVVPAFAASADFAIDKPARTPCPNLEQDFRCGIHDQLRPRGFPGCTAFDCLGAGQQVAQVTFGGRDWRAHPDTAQPMFDVFVVMRQLYEFRWYLTEALALTEQLVAIDEGTSNKAGKASEARDRTAAPAAARALREELAEVHDRTERHTRADVDTLRQLDLDAHRAAVNPLLRRTSELVRAQSPASAHGAVATVPAGLGRGQVRGQAHGRGRARRSHSGGTGRHRRRGDLRGAALSGADLLGADLRDADLRGADLRGGYLIGADLRGANLARTDLIGADLRAADLRGAHLSEALFLTRTQLAAANGDRDTEVPPWFTPPAHWRG